MKILRPFSGVAGLFLPAGISCQFSTEKCRANCMALKHQQDANDEINIDFLMSNYNIFINEPVLLIVDLIREDLEKNPQFLNILHWFASGDCSEKISEKVIETIAFLSKTGSILQCGFTRNIEFWKQTQKINKVRIVLTVETEEEIKEYQKLGSLLSVPDYEKGTMKMFYRQRIIPSCSMPYYVLQKNKVEDDCKQCLKKSSGCFVKE
jgi:hypothetical protein